MKKKQTAGHGLAVLFCACAVIWNINLILDLVRGIPDRGLFILHIVCALLWDICAASMLLRYRKEKQKRKAAEAENEA